MKKIKTKELIEALQQKSYSLLKTNVSTFIIP